MENITKRNLYVLSLAAKKYTNKQISLITKLSPVQITRILKTKRKNIDYIFIGYGSKESEERRETLDKILTYQEVYGYGSLTDSDRGYIKLIKMCGGNYRGIRKIYTDRPISELRPAWDYANQASLDDFDYTLIGLTTDKVNSLLY